LNGKQKEPLDEYLDLDGFGRRILFTSPGSTITARMRICEEQIRTM
jgi:hypothetical protein